MSLLTPPDRFDPNDQTIALREGLREAARSGKLTPAVQALTIDELRLLLALYAAAEGEGGWGRIEVELLGMTR